MASVFLSYDREDVDKARVVALALEKAGHSVWWDRHITGGAQYSKAIEQALKTADAVVVLWSERSVESPWVRDEAAAGRDKNKLVPARLDFAEPPLGFRQYQTIDLSGLKNRRRSPALAELSTAVEGLSQQPSPAGPRGPAIGPSESRSRVSNIVLMAVAVLALIAAALFAWKPWSRPPAAPIVAVAAADGSAATRSLVRDLFAQLGSLQAAKADVLQLAEPGSEMRSDLTLKIGASAKSQRMRAADVALIDEKSSTLLWSKKFEQADGNEADLRQQVAYSAAQVLGCASEALSGNGQGMGTATLRLYLSGCADLSSQLAENPRILIRTFRKVTEQAPRFTGGWAKLLLSEIDARIRDLGDPALQADLRAHVEQARKLDPTMAETYIAQAWLQSPRPISGWMRFVDQAVEKDPEHPQALAQHSLGMFHVGRIRRAVEDARQAVQFDPLSPAARDALISALLYAGEIDAAKRELQEAERLWPGASNVVASRFDFEYRYGDPRVALRMVRSGEYRSSLTPAQKSYLEARIDPSPAAIERAVTDARALFERTGSGFAHYVQTLAQFGRNEELMRALLSTSPKLAPGVIVVLFRPHFKELLDDPRFMVIADRFGLIEYWRDSGEWPDFCFRPDLPYDCKAEAAKLAN